MSNQNGNDLSQNNDNSIRKTWRGFGKIANIIVTLLVYVWFGVISIMAGDSCGKSSACTYLDIGLYVGWAWLLFSFFVFASSTLSNKVYSKLFSPLVVIVIYFVIISIFMEF
jgi:hypothetical protein